MSRPASAAPVEMRLASLSPSRLRGRVEILSAVRQQPATKFGQTTKCAAVVDVFDASDFYDRAGVSLLNSCVIKPTRGAERGWSRPRWRCWRRGRSQPRALRGGAEHGKGSVRSAREQGRSRPRLRSRSSASLCPGALAHRDLFPLRHRLIKQPYVVSASNVKKSTGTSVEGAIA